MSSKKDSYTKKDNTYMKLALNLAKARHGLTGINPSVGCVIVKDEKIISIGQTGYNGKPHAEYNAIKNSNESLKGSKMYVTLEPCNHYGKTPPCTKEIIKHNINEVLYSLEDIDKKVKGKSFKIFKMNNISVKKNLLINEVSEFYTPYFFNRQYKLSYVTGNIAISKNNILFSKINKRITDIHSDKFTHFLRYKNDSLLITSKTLNQDNPKLNCRLKGLSQFSPKRIILDKKLETKTNSYIFKTAKKNNTIIFYNNAHISKVLIFKKKSIKLIRLNLNKEGYFDFKLILRKLYNQGCRNLLVEGGNILSKSILKERLFNQFYLYKSPKKLSKSFDYKVFNSFKDLSQNYKSKFKIKKKLGKDSITLYKI